MYLPFDRGAVPVNLGNLGRVRFYARGSRSFELTFRCADGEFGKALDVSEEWRLVELGADELAPIPALVEAVDWNGTECIGLYYSRRGAASLGEFWFEVDDERRCSPRRTVDCSVSCWTRSLTSGMRV